MLTEDRKIMSQNRVSLKRVKKAELEVGSIEEF